ncbi:receptor-type tyrosine-protein phosphatase epsilon-like [Diadema antillarum]|uniref:receptor-type tyrosine-protein phosphatase epsilon-like n=1 Tax=Diadema antillarum TaxID=105358 RepID=UPI003A8AA27F
MTLLWMPWTPGVDQGDPPLVAYKVYRRAPSGEDWMEDQVVNDDVTSVNVTGLDPDTSYLFSVAAVREGLGGEGPRSPELSITTVCGTLPVIDSAPTVSNLSSMGAQLLWNAWIPGVDEWQAPIEGYVVYTRAPDGGWMEVHRVDPKVTSATVGGLRPDTEYAFSIGISLLASCREGPMSEESYASTHCDRPSLPPGNITATATTSDELFVTWTAPSANTANCGSGFTSYVLYYQSISTDAAGNVTIDAAATEWTLTGLGNSRGYAVQLSVVNAVGESEASDVIRAISSQDDGQVVGGVVGLLVTAIIIFVFLFLLRRRRKATQQGKEKKLFTFGMDSCDSSGEHQSRKDKPSFDPRPDGLGKVIIDSAENEYAPAMEDEYELSGNFDRCHPPIDLADFPAFVLKSRQHSESLISEFSDLPKEDLFPQTVARKNANSQKNRYKNILPYDSARVVLEVIPGKPDTDYYNASCMSDANWNQVYIASQGPNKASIGDFWRMIWQENVKTVAMVTKLEELGKGKCLRYWPNEEEGVLKIGNYEIHLTAIDVRGDGVKRTLSVRQGSESRDIHHYQYTAWPDKGVPKHTSSLLRFIRQVRANHGGDSSPLLVHCSAGVGRTGVVLAILTVAENAKRTQKVDIFNIVASMRKRRPFMVQTKEQYIFLYSAVLEYMLWEETEIPVEHFSARLASLKNPSPDDGTSKLGKEFENLCLLSPPPPEKMMRSGRLTKNRTKSRCHNSLPMERNRVMLRSSDSNSDFINASFVQGARTSFVTSQMPMPATLADFWSMVADYKPSCIVMLNDAEESDATCALYWPDEGSTLTYGPFSVTTRSVSQREDAILRLLSVAHLKNRVNYEVQQFQFIGWPRGEAEHVEGARSLVNLIDMLTAAIPVEKDQSMLVHCMDGVGRTGVLCASMECMLQIAEEDAVDVFQSVKTLRADRPNLVQTEEQYRFIYSVIEEYLFRNKVQQVPSLPSDENIYENTDRPSAGSDMTERRQPDTDQNGEHTYGNVEFHEPPRKDGTYENVTFDG